MPESRIIATKEEQKYYPYSGIFKWARETFWTAGQDSYTLPPAQDPDAFMQLINVEPVTQGILQRRRGYSLLSNQSPISPFTRAFAFRSEALSLRRLLWTSPSTILATDETGASILNPVFTPSLNARAPRMVLSRDFGYFADGVQADSKKWDGTTAPNNLTNWGIALNLGSSGPNTAGSASDQAVAGNTGQQGPQFAGTGASVNNPPGGLNWTNPGNITANDSAVALLQFSSATQAFSNNLRGTNFGFTIPSNAVINGIRVTVKVNSSQGANSILQDTNAILVSAGAETGSGRATGSQISTIPTNVNYGGATDLWGGAWTPALINDPSFGFDYAVVNRTPTLSANVGVDSISITVFYTIPGTGSWTNPANITGACDGISATATVSTSNTSDLRAGNFAFTGVAGTITGIQVAITASTSNASVPISLNPILVKNGTAAGLRKNVFVTSTTPSAVVFGGQFDLWGGTWLPTDVNSVTGFGVQFNANTVSNQATLSVDCVQITLFTQTGPLAFTTSTATTNIVLLSGRTYFYTFNNSKTGHNSTLSPASASTGALTGNQVNITGIPTASDLQVDTVLLLATADGNDQTTLFLLGSVPNGTPTFTDTISDSVLLTQAVYQQTDAIGQLHGVANNNLPPTADFPVKHKGRLYMAQGHNLFFSKNLDDVTTSTGSITGRWEEAWPFVNVIDLSEFSETIKALMSDGETLWIGTERNIRRLIGDGPLNFQKPEIQFNECGVLSPEVWKVVFMEGQPVGTLWMTPDFRVMESDFNTYRDVGTPIQDVLNSINPAALNAVHAVYVNKQAFDLYMLHIPTGGNTVPDTVCVYNLRTRKWCIWRPTDQLSASVFNIDVNGIPQWLFASQTGSLYFWDNTVLVDRNGNSPVSYPVTVQTTWLDFGDFSWWKVLNLQILSSDDLALTLAIEGAVTNSDFLNPTQVLPPTVVQPSELRGYLQLPLATSPARHYWFRFTWQSPASTIQNVLTAHHTECVPFARF